jgi:ribosomal protein S4
MKGIFKRIPERTDIAGGVNAKDSSGGINENLIVELYSR